MTNESDVVKAAKALVAIVGPSDKDGVVKAEVWTAGDGHVYRAVRFEEYRELFAALDALKDDV